MILVSLVFRWVVGLIVAVEPNAKYDQKPQQKEVADQNSATSFRGDGDERPVEEKETDDKEEECHRSALPGIALFFHGPLFLLRKYSRGEIHFPSEEYH